VYVGGMCHLPVAPQIHMMKLSFLKLAKIVACLLR
jgi:hypothetical protein